MTADESRASFELAIVGDVHLAWSAEDVRYFNGSSYDAILFVGDLASYRHRTGVAVARSISRLTRPALVLPGNHDGVHVGQLIAEIASSARLQGVFGGHQTDRCAELRDALATVPLCGYTAHEIEGRGGRLGVVAARPHSMGGPNVAFRRYLSAEHGVSTMDQSADRLKRLVDEVRCDRVLFLAHNGPTGLGDRRDDIFGCDFRREEGDFGDPDLREAIEHAEDRGKTVVAVVAGHMHHRLKGGGRRKWLVRRSGTLYVNAARVPRVFRRGGRVVRHHVALRIEDGTAHAVERLVEA